MVNFTTPADGRFAGYVEQYSTRRRNMQPRNKAPYDPGGGTPPPVLIKINPKKQKVKMKAKRILALCLALAL